jgi:UDP-N-acetylmuramate: L-alanyl-gamma-D-glutamyl-meso-diaminopimelate ligase
MRVHFIAIGGSAMHNLALALHKKGLTVTGSDDEIFEPSRSRLENAALLPPSMGWHPERITENLDYIVLGMHARKDNPELLRAQELGLKVFSYPEFLYEQSKDKTRVVIAGSHGKTSITAMVLHVLNYHNRDCDYMLGAQLEGFDTMVKITGHNEFMLLEGDEYLSSPIDRRPKFLHYRPNICLISGIAWDHVNVFPTFNDYLKQFELLIEAIEPGGALVYNELDEDLAGIVENTTHEVKKFPYGYPEFEIEDGIVSLVTEEGMVPLSIFGKHNMNNLEGARWICNQMGISDEEFYTAIPDFKGASRRLELLDAGEKLRIYRDFAHAPSKVRATVQAVRENFPKHHLIACLELHTFSSLNPDFIGEYSGSMAAGDTACVYFNPEVVAHKKLPPLQSEQVKREFNEPGLQVFDNNQHLLAYLQEHIDPDQPSILLVMSSGSFDGIDWLSEFKKFI